MHFFLAPSSFPPHQFLCSKGNMLWTFQMNTKAFPCRCFIHIDNQTQ